MSRRCDCGWPIFSPVSVVAMCPQCGQSVAVEGSSDALHQDKDEICRGLWAELHSQHEPSPEWFTDWQRRIPNINCDCRRHWRELVAEMPPDFSSRSNFFRWTVEAHNAVNLRLGKPPVTLEEAYRLHTPAKLCVTCGQPATTICSHTLSLGMCGEPLCGSCTHLHVL